jgi:hypothetical protein
VALPAAVAVGPQIVEQVASGAKDKAQLYVVLNG